jgi:hypothetical protein
VVDALLAFVPQALAFAAQLADGRRSLGARGFLGRDSLGRLVLGRCVERRVVVRLDRVSQMGGVHVRQRVADAPADLRTLTFW